MRDELYKAAQLGLDALKTALGRVSKELAAVDAPLDVVGARSRSAGVFARVCGLAPIARLEIPPTHPRASQRDGMSALLCAAVAGNEEAVASLLYCGASDSVADATGQAALHKSVQGGNDSVLKLLLKIGADINHQSAWV